MEAKETNHRNEPNTHNVHFIIVLMAQSTRFMSGKKVHTQRQKKKL